VFHERADVAKVAARMLANAQGRPVRVEIIDDLSGRRSTILRLRTVEAATPTIIAKRPRELARDIADGRSPAERFDAETSALRLLENTGGDLAPKLIVFDRAEGVLLLEDVGAGPTLADLLLGRRRETAERVIVSFARRLGELHTATLRAPDRAGTAPNIGGRLDGGTTTDESFRRSFSVLLDVAAELGVEPRTDCRDDVDDVGATIFTEPGPVLALTSGDVCPDNAVLRAGTLAFVDFERACFRHALLDLAYLPLGFPTCWCAGLMPEALLADALEAYRAATRTTFKQWDERPLFVRALLRAVAAVAISASAERVGLALRGDREVRPHGPTRRGVVLTELEELGRMCARVSDLFALGRFGLALAEALRKRWGLPDGAALRPHPALRESVSEE
jgi:Phosphotransferase enzyme family